MLLRLFLAIIYDTLRLNIIQLEWVREDHALGKVEAEIETLNHTGCNVARIVNSRVMTALELEATELQHVGHATHRWPSHILDVLYHMIWL